MNRTITTRALMLAGLIGAFLGATPAAAQSAGDFYKGRQITFIVGGGVGGSYGLYARTIAPYLTKHIAGNPSVVVQHIEGGGGVPASNYVHNVAPKDGSYIGMTQMNAVMQQVVRPAAIKYDSRTWHWIGNVSPMRSVVAVRKDSGVASLEDAKKKEVVMGATSKASEMYMTPALLNHYQGTKFKIVLGYPGMAQTMLAIEKGEVQGRAGSYVSLASSHAPWLKEGKLSLLTQMALTRDPAMKDVPLMQDLAKSDEERKVYFLNAAQTAFGRSIFVPGGVPADRVAALRAGFQAAVKDAAFLADAARQKMPVEPMSGEELVAVARDLLDTPPAIVKAFQAATAGK